LPEAVNAIIGQRKAAYPGLHKVGTDMAVPDDQLHNVFAMYRRDLAASGIDSVVFGHIGDNHLHVNLLPRDINELELAKTLYQGWAELVVKMGGAVAAEHGIGRIKKRMLELQYSQSTLDLMRQVRKAFDPQGLLAPGVLVDR
jgi:D-lactate dehydrogenase (cytochrome)